MKKYFVVMKEGIKIGEGEEERSGTEKEQTGRRVTKEEMRRK